MFDFTPIFCIFFINFYLFDMVLDFRLLSTLSIFILVTIAITHFNNIYCHHSFLILFVIIVYHSIYFDWALRFVIISFRDWNYHLISDYKSFDHFFVIFVVFSAIKPHFLFISSSIFQLGYSKTMKFSLFIGFLNDYYNYYYLMLIFFIFKQFLCTIRSKFLTGKLLLLISFQASYKYF